MAAPIHPIQAAHASLHRARRQAAAVMGTVAALLMGATVFAAIYAVLRQLQVLP
ncbi:hypothetical protein V5F77_10480 [Xanthobacter sp. DSM 24535]|uniref:hypothetical protein n=1 Tax=Roseixanthobacter psychrophilus TaxID=3119917 RepID=UPI0037279039